MPYLEEVGPAPRSAVYPPEAPEMPSEDSYFQYQTGWGRMFVRLSLNARRKMAELFWEAFRPGPRTSVLDVGITSNAREDSNYFEKWYPYPESLTCVGT
jgi:hypothetical protein